MVECGRPKASWNGESYWGDKLVCRDSGRIIVEVNSVNDVIGADGVKYGRFMTLEQAKERAEEVVSSFHSFWFGHSALRCP
jgi:hypothetical protein